MAKLVDSVYKRAVQRAKQHELFHDYSTRIAAATINDVIQQSSAKNELQRPRFQNQPPERGSFPLDHDRACTPLRTSSRLPEGRGQRARAYRR